MARSPDGRQIVSAGRDRSERIWGTTSGEELVAFRGHGAAVDVTLAGDNPTIEAIAAKVTAASTT